MHNVIFENGGGEIFVSINTLLRINVACRVKTPEPIIENATLPPYMSLGPTRHFATALVATTRTHRPQTTSQAEERKI